MFQTVWWNTRVFQAVPDVPGYSRTYRKVEEALVHGIACPALLFLLHGRTPFRLCPFTCGAIFMHETDVFITITV